jgi:hypothetical protein
VDSGADLIRPGGNDCGRVYFNCGGVFLASGPGDTSERIQQLAVSLLPLVLKQSELALEFREGLL